MLFILSKVFWVLVQPVSLTFLLFLLAWLLVLRNRRRAGLVAGALGLTLLGVSAFTTAGALLIMPLENRFVRPAEMPEQVSAIIMLGGATSGRVSTRRQIPELTEAGDRLTETLRLAQLYPEARVVVSGGSGLMVPDGESEATTAERFFTGLGIDPARLVLEGDSRNTDENAKMTLALLGGEVSGNVLLVTSAFHMPRSIGIFRKVGLDVIAWPTDYRSGGDESVGFDIVNPVLNVTTTGVAIREWIGLVTYSWIGRTSEMFPAQGSN
ncbi:YdcF family protein [Devosia lacusdianchii]|uniref:YdcF family protein n=1 Tax=Devosia lacusdianchii TaxID=2917991 RepID=UPI001F06AF5F|nr:YdcF family protein [Devosia sp. JXJ CY 41]